MTVIACAVMAVVYDKLPVNSYVAAFIFFIAVFAVMLILHIVGVVVMRNGYKISIVISLVAVEVFIGAFSMTGLLSSTHMRHTSMEIMCSLQLMPLITLR